MSCELCGTVGRCRQSIDDADDTTGCFDVGMSSPINSYRDLDAWRHAAKLAIEVYRLVAQLPNSERFGLMSQSQRAAVSVAANIAEGYGRGSRREFLRFLLIARGSLRELDTHLYFLRELKLLPADAMEQSARLCDSTGAILEGLIRSIRRPARPRA